jgi:hypothetical protein
LVLWLIEDMEESFPVIEQIVHGAEEAAASKFERQFTRTFKREAAERLSTGGSWKLARLELLYFLDRAVSTCPDPPDHLIVPQQVSTPMCDNWTAQDDRLLMYGNWKFGYNRYENVQFSVPELPNRHIVTDRRNGWFRV